MTALTTWVLRHRRWVVLAWVALALAGGLAAPRAVDRLGYAFDRVLVYGTGGFAYGGGARSTYAASYPYTLPSTDRTGYAAGGGIEYAFTEKLSAKVEALYLHLGRGTTAATYYNASVPAFYGAGKQDSGLALVRAGVNYRF